MNLGFIVLCCECYHICNFSVCFVIKSKQFVSSHNDDRNRKNPWLSPEKEDFLSSQNM